jgi:hypothetical protein
MLFDTLIPSLAVGIKSQGGSALPTRTGGVQVSRRGGRPEWYTVIGLSLFNICLGVAVQAGVELLFTEVLSIRSALKVTTTLPMPWGLAKDVVRGLLLREVMSIVLSTKIVLIINRYLATTFTDLSCIRALQTSSANSTIRTFTQ